jgi:peptidoglycan-associated lipoprotein
MKINRFAYLLVLGLVVSVAASGCKKRPSTLTPLPGSAKTTAVPDPGPSGIGTASPGPGTGVVGNETPTGEKFSGTKQGDPASFDNMIPNAEIFKQDTVFFDFDSSAIKAGEQSKIAHVADYLKANNTPRTAVRIEGHCDERGTEEYNRSLGERRAIAIREELIKLGLESTRVDTVSFGEDRPAVPGHDEAAYRQNRRGAFILLTERQ